ncbi:ribonuclease R [Candidatus Kaiserbacteria bacterium]|nr:ribonuclease R [Candidatus Kaiserbacteria bacterium]
MKAKKGSEPKKKRHERTRTEGIISVTSRGVGYLPVEGFEEDIEIPRELLNTALNRDTVEVLIHPKRQGVRAQGEVVRVISRARTEFVGVLKEENGFYYLVPDDRRMYADILIPKTAEDSEKRTSGDVKVLVRLVKWDDPRKDPEGKILKVIGKKGEHETEMQAIVLAHNFDTDFPTEVEKEAEQIKKQKIVSAEEAAKRRDMRAVTTFTIDPANAKDFDDALSIRSIDENTTEVGIHIADVTHYVRPRSAIDKEAQERGTSIYLVDRTIQMLPEALSNDVCSLNPNEDKLTFSAIFELDRDGTVKKRWFGRTVINSNKRFTYEEAQKSLDLGNGPFSNELKILEVLARKLRGKRFREGSIAFETDEVVFELDERNRPTGVKVKERLETMLLIEDFMLLANREVAKFLYDHSTKHGVRDTVLIYRIHDVPDEDKIEELAVFLRAIGYDLKVRKGMVDSKDINRLLKDIKGKPEERLIQTATIRSMAKAIYSTKNIGHFSLSFRYYTHFTSPIRRYPDMMVHRILGSHLDNSKIPESELNVYRRLAIESSQREVEAASAERDSIKYKQVEYMKNHIGEVFDGVITGVTDFGVFVEETKTKAEGMIRLRDLADDYYMFEKKKYALVGKKKKKVYQLGDTLKIKLIEANLDQKTITWKPA